LGGFLGSPKTLGRYATGNRSFLFPISFKFISFQYEMCTYKKKTKLITS
jgi:hypothetical protein